MNKGPLLVVLWIRENSIIGSIWIVKFMNKKVFVGNLSFKLSESDLEQLFSQSGQVVSVVIPTDAETGRKRGFAFVEMGSPAEAEAAIQALNGQEVQGRAIAVSLSRPKENNRPQRSGGGGGGRRF